MEKLENSVPNVIPRVFIAVIDLLERDSSQFLWKIQRNLKNVSLMLASIPAKVRKCHASLSVGLEHLPQMILLRNQPTLPRTPEWALSTGKLPRRLAQEQCG